METTAFIHLLSDQTTSQDSTHRASEKYDTWRLFLQA
jgi:hypothetical protein